jgi:hypothetical protein
MDRAFSISSVLSSPFGAPLIVEPALVSKPNKKYSFVVEKTDLPQKPAPAHLSEPKHKLSQ